MTDSLVTRTTPERVLPEHEEKSLGQLDAALDQVIESAGLNLSSQDLIQLEAAAQQGLEFRRSVQGDEWWQTQDTQLRLNTLRKILALTDAQRKVLADANKKFREGAALLENGSAKESITLLEASRKQHRSILGSEFLHFGSPLQQIIRGQWTLGQMDNALTAIGELNEILATEFSGDHPQKALVLFQLSNTLLVEERIDEALAATISWLAMSKRLGNLQMPVYARFLFHVAVQLRDRQRYPEAIQIAQECVSMYRRLFPGDHPDKEAALWVLGDILIRSDRSGEGYGTLLSALEIRQRMGHDVRDPLINSLIEFGLGLSRVLLPNEALNYFERALDLIESSKSKDFKTRAQILVNMSRVHLDLGHFEVALNLSEKALAVVRRHLPDDEREVARIMKVVGICNQKLGRPVEALDQYTEAIQLLSKKSNENEAELVSLLDHEASVYYDLKLYDSAVEAHKISLDIRRQASSDDDLNIARGMNNLGLSLLLDSRNSESLIYLTRALEMTSRLQGDDSYQAMAILSNLALLHARNHDAIQAQEFSFRMARAEYLYLHQLFSLLTPQQKRLYRAGNANGLSANLGLAFAPNEGSVAKSFEINLLAKQPFIDISRSEHVNMRMSKQQSGDEINELWKKRENLRRQIAAAYVWNLTSRKSAIEATASTRASMLRDLNQELESIELYFRREYPNLTKSPEMIPPTMDDVVAALQYDSAHLEYVEFRPFDSSNGRFRASRYGVFVVTPVGIVLAIDLGPRKNIDQAIERFRETVADFSAQWEENLNPKLTTPPIIQQINEDRNNPGVLSETRTALASEALRKLIWDPIAPFLARTDRVYIAPEGHLSLFPFEALAEHTDSGWRYLVEDFEIIYLNTGRDLARFADAPLQKTAENRAILVGDPDFSADTATIARTVFAAPSVEVPESSKSIFKATPSESIEGKLGPARRGRMRTKLRIEPKLKTFVDGIEERFDAMEGWSLTTIRGRNAFEEAILSIQSPRLLQFATHGEFISASLDESHIGWDDPLLRSMLYLAGRDSWSPENAVHYALNGNVLSATEVRDRGLDVDELKNASFEIGDGVLTAYEVAGMSLLGTELVNLTACETGVGKITPDGVSGLRSAFLMAGARALTMSMWEVSADHTLKQMEDFYEYWLGDGTKKKRMTHYKAFHKSQRDALQRARDRAKEPHTSKEKSRRENLGHDANAHPFYWAGTIYFGDPGDLPEIETAQVATETPPVSF